MNSGTAPTTMRCNIVVNGDSDSEGDISDGEKTDIGE